LEGDVVDAIRELKNGTGRELQVHGSGTLIQTLLENDLVDELWLKIFPVTIGSSRNSSPTGQPWRASRSWRAVPR
jgi:dihydrofolate reductase